MDRISIINKKNTFIVTNRLQASEEVNSRELALISKGMVSRLIPVTTYRKRKINFLECKVEGMIPLNNFFKKVIDKKTFLDIILKIVKIIKDCDKNIMNIKNLGLDINYIFIDAKTKELSFIYWPIVNLQGYINLSEFFGDMAYRVIFDRNEDIGYVSEYIQFFKGCNSFSQDNFEKFIMKLAGMNIEYPQTNVSMGLSSRLYGNEKKENLTGGLSSYAAYYSPVDNMVPAKNFNETTLLGEDDDIEDGGTTLLDEDEGVGMTFPYIIREKTGEKIFIDKPCFRIGKEKRFCDYFIFDNNAISRSHADIITKNGHYFIYDNNSTNKTYVEGRAIPVHKEVEIFSGTKFRLANEDFTFYI